MESDSPLRFERRWPRLVTGSSMRVEETEFDLPASGLRKFGAGRLLMDGSNPPFAVTLPFVGEIIFVVS